MTIKIKYLENHLLLLAILLCLLSNTIEKSTTFLSFFYIDSIKNIIYLLLFSSFFIVLSKIKISTRLLLSITILLLCTFLFLFLKIFFGEIELETYIKVLILVPFIFYRNIDLKYTNSIKIILLIFIVVALYYSYFQNFYQGLSNRQVYNSTDPNISSMYILFAFFLARKVNSKLLMAVLFTLGVLTFSRNFILSIIILYFFSFIKKSDKFYNFFKFNFVGLLLLLNIFVIMISYSYKNVDYEQGSGTDSSRLTSVQDESNAIRFEINRKVLNAIFLNPDNLIFGLGPEYPSDSKLNINYKSHNGLIDFIGMYGVIYSILFFSLLYLVIERDNRPENLEYFYSYAVFTLFLPGLTGGVYLITFLFIIKLNHKYLHTHITTTKLEKVHI